MLLAIWDLTGNMRLHCFSMGKQSKQAKQYIWEWSRVVVSEVPDSCQQFTFPVNYKEVWQVRWAASCSFSPFTQTYSHCGLSSPVILSGFQVFQMERKVDVAPQEDLDVRSAWLAEERSINHSLLCNFWVWRDLVILVPLIFGCYHQILQFLLGESED